MFCLPVLPWGKPSSTTRSACFSSDDNNSKPIRRNKLLIFTTSNLNPPANMNSSLPSWKDRTQNHFGKLQIQVPWRSMKLLVPHRMRRKLRSKLRSRITPTSSLSSLQTSFSPVDTLRSLQSHRWTLYDFQYLLLLIVCIFSLTIIESPGPLGKTAMFTGLLVSLLLPITRQFFLPFLPIAGWLLFFYACQ